MSRNGLKVIHEMHYVHYIITLLFQNCKKTSPMKLVSHIYNIVEYISDHVLKNNIIMTTLKLGY